MNAVVVTNQRWDCSSSDNFEPLSYNGQQNESGHEVVDHVKIAWIPNLGFCLGEFPCDVVGCGCACFRQLGNTNQCEECHHENQNHGVQAEMFSSSLGGLLNQIWPRDTEWRLWWGVYDATRGVVVQHRVIDKTDIPGIRVVWHLSCLHLCICWVF